MLIIRLAHCRQTGFRIGGSCMRTFIGVIAGFCLTSVLILAGEWGFTIFSPPGLQLGHTPLSFFVVLLSLLYVGITVIVGGYLAAIINDSQETIAGYSVFQLFFGVWFFRDFWTTGFAWYRPVVLFLIIPCAMLGRYWVRRTRRESGAHDQAAYQASSR